MTKMMIQNGLLIGLFMGFSPLLNFSQTWFSAGSHFTLLQRLVSKFLSVNFDSTQILNAHSHFQTCLFMWCMAPIKSNGSQFIYSHVILPWFLKNETKIDAAFKRGQNLVDEGLNEAEKLAREKAAEAMTSKND